MMSEGSSFMKGMILGGIFCLVLSFFGTFNSGTHSEGHEHLHHHLKPASKDELLKFSESQMSGLGPAGSSVLSHHGHAKAPGPLGDSQ